MKSFLTAEWLYLAMINYSVEPAVLQPWLPRGTELDFFNNNCYVSLVAFRFWNTRLKGIPIPFHRNFEEINLRFYVKRKENNEWKRGVVFIREIVPKPALSLVANIFYQERYVTMPTRSSITHHNKSIEAHYKWGKKANNELLVTATDTPQPIGSESEEAFITEHYWGYARAKKDVTNEYKVEHPQWLTYPVQNWKVECDFNNLYGAGFASLATQKPHSVLLAQGSPVIVFAGKKLLQ